MQAVLIATADSEKLWPLTETTPSSLLPIGNRPVMEIVLEQLARSGFKKIIVCLHRMAGDIEVYFGDGSRWGVAIEYVLMPEAWGSAGALFWAKSLIIEPFIVMPADAIIDLDISAAFEQHRLNQYAATVILHKNEIRPERKISPEEAESCKGKPTEIKYEQWCSETGVYIFEPGILNQIPGRKRFEIDTHFLPVLSEVGLPVGALVIEGYWNPLDTFCEFQDAQKTLLYSLWRKSPLPFKKFLAQYSQLLGKEVSAGVWVGRNTVIHPTARLVPPVLLAENIRVGSGVVLGPEVVIGSDTIIAARASIRSSTIFDHTYVGQLVHIEDHLVDKSLVVDTDSAEHVHISDQFLLNETPSTVPVRSLYHILEVAVALLLLLVTTPLTLPIGLFSWLSFGKIFQREPRLKMAPGRPDSKESCQAAFSLLRFQTRRSTGQTNRFGRWLERFELNCLPEFWNVVTGDMRLVGTKPLAPEEAYYLTATWQNGFVDHIPGFTGLWYVQPDPCRDLDETIVANVYYAATRSWKEDLRILLMTPRAWFKKIKQPGCKEILPGEK